MSLRVRDKNTGTVYEVASTPAVDSVLSATSTNAIQNQAVHAALQEKNSIAGASDVAIASPSDGDVLTYDAATSKWVNGAGSVTIDELGDIADVDLTNLEDGQIIVWDAANSKWVNRAGGTTIDELNDIGDVNITTPSDGDVLAYDDTNDEWINKTLGTASAKDVPTSGNASASQVVMGNDSRLTDARNAADVFTGTTAQWTALSAADKAKYHIVNLTDDVAGGDMYVEDAVTEDSTNPVTSGAVWAAIQEALRGGGMQKNYVFKVRTDSGSSSDGECVIDISDLSDSDKVCITATYSGSGWCRNYTVDYMKSNWSSYTWIETQANIGPEFKCIDGKLYVRGHDGYMNDVIVTLP